MCVNMCVHARVQVTFSPPRELVGAAGGPLPRVGLRVARSVAFQTWPRSGSGIVAAVLTENMDLVAVNWTLGPTLQPCPTGQDGSYSLVLWDPPSVNVTLRSPLPPIHPSSQPSPTGHAASLIPPLVPTSYAATSSLNRP